MKTITFRDKDKRATGEPFREALVKSEDDKSYLLHEHDLYWICKSQIEIKIN